MLVVWKEVAIVCSESCREECSKCARARAREGDRAVSRKAPSLSPVNGGKARRLRQVMRRSNQRSTSLPC